MPADRSEGEVGGDGGGVAPAPRLLDQLRSAIRIRHYSIRTETAYVGWVRRYIRFHGLRHPREMGAVEAEAFLADLAVRCGVSASTQAQARSALLFLYKEVLKADLPWLAELPSGRGTRRLPVVLTEREVAALWLGRRHCTRPTSRLAAAR